MQRKSLLIFSAIALFVLGIVMIVMGINMGDTLNPPEITGIGFFIIATVFMSMGRSVK